MSLGVPGFPTFSGRGCAVIVGVLLFALSIVAMVVVYILVLAPNFFSHMGDSSSGTGPGSGLGSGSVPVISARDYSGGSTPVRVSGAFSLNQSIGLDPPSSSSDGTRTDIRYGEPETGLVHISIVSGEDEGYGLNVELGELVAQAKEQDCTWKVEVAPATVSGHVSCKDVVVVDEQIHDQGRVSIDLDFTANS